MKKKKKAPPRQQGRSPGIKKKTSKIAKIKRWLAQRKKKKQKR